MAINPLSLCQISPACSLSSKSGPGPCQKIKMDLAVVHKSPNRFRNQFKSKSPYLHAGDRVSYRSHTEKRVFNKQFESYVPSFPFPANLYKADSDKLPESSKHKKHMPAKKVKKSVLTLPNDQTPMLQTCTVSDLDAPLYETEMERKLKIMKRVPLRNRKKHTAPRDQHSKIFSLMNLGSSSANTLKPFHGDGKKCPKKNHYKEPAEEEARNGVWEVLNDINKFRNIRSRPMSMSSSASTKKNVVLSKRNTRKGNRRLIETCRTEEISYVANFEFESKDVRETPSSSCDDRITVISKPSNNLKDRRTAPPNVRLTKRRDSLQNIIKINKMIKTKKQVKVAPPTNIRKNETLEKKYDVLESPDSNFSVNVPSIDSSNYYASINKAPGGESTNKEKKYFHGEHKVNSWNHSTLHLRAKDATYRTTNHKLQADKHGLVVNKLAKNVPGSQNDPDPRRVDIEVARSPRLVPRPPISRTVPPGYVKRKLAYVKFPMLILGNDQVSADFEVPDWDHPQFNGLDKKIWPFMTKWTAKECGTKQSHLLQHNNKKQSANNNPRRTRDSSKIIEVSIKKRPKENISADHSPTGTKTVEPKLNYVSTVKSNLANNTATPNRNQVSSVLRRDTSPANHVKPVIVQSNCGNMTAHNPNQVSSALKPEQSPVNHLKIKVLKVDKKPKETNIDVTHESHERDERQKKSSKLKTYPNARKVDTWTETIATEEATTQLPPTSPVELLETIITQDRRPDLGKDISTKSKITKPSWAKGKQNNEFIDNIIHKVKSGVYYNPECFSMFTTTKNVNSCLNIVTMNGEIDKNVNSCLNIVTMNGEIENTQGAILNKIMSQTGFSHRSIDNSDNEKLTNDVVVLKADDHDPFKSIQGFDECLPGIEIKSLTMNQIIVEQCTTNILVHFDTNSIVKSRAGPSELGTVYGCIPLRKTEGHCVFKYKSTILNGVLPAQLCFLLPRLTSSPLLDYTSLHLPKISEGSFAGKLDDIMRMPMQLFRYMSVVVKQLLQGTYLGKKTWIKPNITRVPRPIMTYGSEFTHFYDVIPQKIYSVIELHKFTTAIKPVISKIDAPCTSFVPNTGSKALVPYTGATALLPHTGTTASILNTGVNAMLSLAFSSLRIHQNNEIMSCNNTNFRISMPTFISSINLIRLETPITINTLVKTLTNTRNIETNISVTSSDVKLKLHINGFSKSRNDVKLEPLFDGILQPKSVKAQLALQSSDSRKKSELSQKCQKYIHAYRTGKRVINYIATTKCNRRPYVNRKYNSMTSIEKSSWSLSNITTIERFLKCVGSVKTWMSILDGDAEKKVLAAVCQMKSWIKEISARQALLVLLLINKRHTPNLTRGSTLLLQGIAMNRITSASQLDTEIAVIEKDANISLETFNGTANLADSLGNKIIFEELREIARTTAADHGRPFDEASEIMLKSLLERNPKNPTYLRVMARYVGLGLLKSSKTHST